MSSPQSPSSRRPTGLFVGGLVIVVLILGGVGVLASQRRGAVVKEGEARREEAAVGPRVLVVQAALSPASRKVELQGEARPFASVTLYAKVSGYLKTIRVDKGDRVTRDQVIATIESPELDRQYDAAVADARFKRANATRARSLAKPGVVSETDAELTESQAAVAEAQVAALGQQRSYETLRAPFAGTVTARFADPGALVQNATNAQTGALPVVTISQTNRLRVTAYLDQRDAALVHEGDAAEVRVPERGLVRAGKVSRLARELDPRSRTMLAEIDVDNTDGSIVAGSFVTVALVLQTPRQVELPVEALVVRDKKPFASVIDGENKLRFKPVVVAIDDGVRARLSEGLEPGAKVALNVGESLAEGTPVTPVSPPPRK